MKQISRRTLLKGLGAMGATSALGWSPSISFAQALSCENVNRVLIVLHASGGMCNNSLLPPRTSNAAYEAYLSQYPLLGLRENQQLAFGSSVLGGAQFGLHPAFEEIHAIANGASGVPGIGAAFFNQVGFRNSAGGDVTDRSHEVATQQFAAGDPQPGALASPLASGSGWVGRFAQNYCSGAFNMVNLSGISRFSKAPDVGVLSGGSLEGFKYADDAGVYSSAHYIGRNQFQRDMTHAFNFAGGVSMHPAQNMFHTMHESADQAVELLASTRQSYTAPPSGTYTSYPGEHPRLHQQFKDAAALIRDHQNTRVRLIALRWGNFDTHSGAGSIQNGTYGPVFRDSDGRFLGPQASLLNSLARGIAGLFRDLHRLRMADSSIPEVVLLVTSEVGRTFENKDQANGVANHGTDHGQASASIVVGSGVRNLVHANYTPTMFTNPAPWSPWLTAQVDTRMIYRDIAERFMNRNGAPLFTGNYPTNYVQGGSIFL